MIETLAAGCILLVSASMLLNGFLTANRLLHRGDEVIRSLESARERVECSLPADREETCDLILRTSDGEEIAVETVRCIYEIGNGEEGAFLSSWSILKRTEEDE